MKRFAGWFFTAALIAAPSLAQEWIPLQDGKSLAGWKAAERPEAWVVEDGAFVSRGDRSHLFYVGKVAKHDFRNFELSLEVMTSPGANSGVYVHTKWQGPGWPAAGYELQVINSNPKVDSKDAYVEHKMTGSIYAVRNAWVAPAKDNEWFTYRIRVVGNTIQTFVNDQLVAEYAEPANAPRQPDKQGRRLGSGTFALQAHDPGSVVKYRNIKVKLLPKDAAPPEGLVSLSDPELDALVSWASDVNIPLIDFGVAVPKDDPRKVRGLLRRYGMTPINEFPFDAVIRVPGSLVMVVDRDKAPDLAVLKAAKAAGARIAFSAGGDGVIEEAQLKRRLQAIKEAGLGWQDFWVPGK
jgi:hypothetical protein